MRVYLPLLGSELFGNSLSSRRGFTAIASNAADSEIIEVLGGDAQTEAALVPLMELREREGEPMVRLIVVVDIADTTPEDEGEDEGVVETAEIAVSRSEVVVTLADSGEAVPAALKVVEANEQDEVDKAVVALQEHVSEWFNVSERESLARALGL